MDGEMDGGWMGGWMDVWGEYALINRQMNVHR